MYNTDTNSPKKNCEAETNVETAAGLLEHVSNIIPHVFVSVSTYQSPDKESVPTLLVDTLTKIGHTNNNDYSNGHGWLLSRQKPVEYWPD